MAGRRIAARSHSGGRRGADRPVLSLRLGGIFQTCAVLQRASGVRATLCYRTRRLLLCAMLVEPTQFDLAAVVNNTGIRLPDLALFTEGIGQAQTKRVG